MVSTVNLRAAAAAPPCSTSRAGARPAARRAALRCAAAADERPGGAAGEPPAFSFDSNRRATLGYTESDSAGQTNVFYVEPKVYVAGSAADATAADGNKTAIAGVLGFVAASGLIAAGLTVLGGDAGTTLASAAAPAAQYRAVSAYAAAFAAEAAPAPAPALAEPAAAQE